MSTGQFIVAGMATYIAMQVLKQLWWSLAPKVFVGVQPIRGLPLITLVVLTAWAVTHRLLLSSDMPYTYVDVLVVVFVSHIAHEAHNVLQALYDWLRTTALVAAARPRR